MRTLLLTLLICAACATDATGPDVEADVEPLTTCWNTLVATTTPGWPPLDMYVSAKAMQQWLGGSWKPCTDNADDTKVICKRFIGTQQVTAYWNYCLPPGGPSCTMTMFYTPTADELVTPLHGMQVWASDWDDNVYTHGVLSPANDNSFTSGTVDVTHSSGNNWNVHTCVTQ